MATKEEIERLKKAAEDAGFDEQTADEIYDDEIHEELGETRRGFECSCGKVFRTDYELLAHIGKPVLYTQEDLDEAIQEARADERNRIGIIINRGTLHSKEKALDDVINYLKTKG